MPLQTVTAATEIKSSAASAIVEPAAFTAFYRNTHPKALRFASAYFERKEDAEDIVADAFLRVWQEKTPLNYFFRVLRFTILDRLRTLYRVPAETIRLDMRLPREAANRRGGNPNELPGERTASSHAGDQDYLERTIRAEDLKSAYEEVKGDSRFRWVRQLKWWKELDEHYSQAAA